MQVPCYRSLLPVKQIPKSHSARNDATTQSLKQKIKAPENGGLTWMHRINTDKDTIKSIREENQQGESMCFSNNLFLFAFILLIHVQMLFIGRIVLNVFRRVVAPLRRCVKPF
jgi:hypothetical protein